MFSRNLACIKCEENILEAVKQEGQLCDDVEAYLGDR